MWNLEPSFFVAEYLNTNLPINNIKILGCSFIKMEFLKAIALLGLQ